MQLKDASSVRIRTVPIAPSVYRPQPTPTVLQKKEVISQRTMLSSAQQALPAKNRPEDTAARLASSFPRIGASPVHNLPPAVTSKHPNAPKHRAHAAISPKPEGSTAASGTVQRSRIQPATARLGAIQLAAAAFCPMCKSCGLDSDHSPKKCPLLENDEAAPVADAEEELKGGRGRKWGKKKEEQFHDLGVSEAKAEARPAVGMTRADLANINKFKWPDVYLDTLINIGAVVEIPGRTLSHKKGKPGETREHRISVPGTNEFVVIHYHPRAVLPHGAYDGHSLVHIKGEKSKGERGHISPAKLAAMGLPVPDGHT
ncbi:MAG TPA: hypothetical protein VFI24_20855 [Pyrinomonadaceae bacterium]|nr:hypothetical protein [Pyrinomonadaceae bacterium]